MNNFSQDTVSKISLQIAKQTEDLLLSQLNEFISRGLIVVEDGGRTFVREAASANITYRQSVNLVLRDKEYILKLEDENKSLRTRLEEIEAFMSTFNKA